MEATESAMTDLAKRMNELEDLVEAQKAQLAECSRMAQLYENEINALRSRLVAVQLVIRP
jgi:prefoldin subunit 5